LGSFSANPEVLTTGCLHISGDSIKAGLLACSVEKGEGSGTNYSMNDIEGGETVEMMCADCRWCPMHVVAQLTVQKTAVAI